MHIGIGDFYRATCNHYNHFCSLYSHNTASDYAVFWRSRSADARDGNYLRVKYNSKRLRRKKKILQVTPKLDSVRGNNNINCTSRQQQRHTTLHRVVSSNFFPLNKKIKFRRVRRIRIPHPTWRFQFQSRARW